MYYAVVLDKRSRNKLIKQFNLDLNTKYAHHCTMFYISKNKILNPVEKKLKAFLDEHLGYRVDFYADTLCKNQFVQAIGVCNILSTNENPHITLSVAKGHKPVESNYLDWEDGLIEINRIDLTGYITLCK